MNEKNIIVGTIIHGDGYGRKLGFPTINLDRRQFVRSKIKIKLGIYAGWVAIGSSDLLQPAAIVIGPLDAKKLPKLEAHLIGYSGNLYGKKAKIILYQYIRSFTTYTSEAVLKKQIAADIKAINKVLYVYGNNKKR